MSHHPHSDDDIAVGGDPIPLRDVLALVSHDWISSISCAAHTTTTVGNYPSSLTRCTCDRLLAKWEGLKARALELDQAMAGENGSMGGGLRLRTRTVHIWATARAKVKGAHCLLLFQL